jgi:hypothetical protein
MTQPITFAPLATGGQRPWLGGAHLLAQKGMRGGLILAAMLAFDAAPALAGSASDMALQRCVWACLANSSGNNDPRYEACVERRCVKNKGKQTRRRK